MSALLELSTAVRTRRADMGLTQATLAKLSGLSRATVNQLETATIKDLSLTRVSQLLGELGLFLTVSTPHPSSRIKPRAKTPALELAARTASVSYRVPLQAQDLRQALSGSEVPRRHGPQLSTLLDEASVSLLASVVEQLHTEDGLERAQVWKTMRTLAQNFKSPRAVWQ